MVRSGGLALARYDLLRYGAERESGKADRNWTEATDVPCSRCKEVFVVMSTSITIHSSHFCFPHPMSSKLEILRCIPGVCG